MGLVDRSRCQEDSVRLRVLTLLSIVAAVLAIAAGTASASPAPTVVPAPAADTGLTCNAAFTLWSGGYFANVTVHNGGTVAVTGWAVTFTLPGNMTVNGGWNATITITGRRVVIGPGGWNTALAPGASAVLGFTGSYVGTFIPPPDLAVNGVPCTVQIS
jgi:cellulase/cellobiase CelA1